MEKKCLECDTKLIGRIDKKFCNDYCRNSYNNNINKDEKTIIRIVNNRLKKNWRILETCNPDKKSKATKSKLLSLGFDFNYYTNTYITKSGTVYYFVYNQGYLPIDNDYYALVKRD